MESGPILLVDRKASVTPRHGPTVSPGLLESVTESPTAASRSFRVRVSPSPALATPGRAGPGRSESAGTVRVGLTGRDFDASSFTSHPSDLATHAPRVADLIAFFVFCHHVAKRIYTGID